MRIAYLDTFSGISGDMTVGALLRPRAAARRACVMPSPRSDLDGCRGCRAERVERSGIAATKFHVRVDGEHPDDVGHHHRHDHHAIVRIARSAICSPRARSSPRCASARSPSSRRSRTPRRRVHGVAGRATSRSTRSARSTRSSTSSARRSGFTHLGVDAVYSAPLPLGRGLVARGARPLAGPGTGRARELLARPARASRRRRRRARDADRRRHRRGARAPSRCPSSASTAVGYGAGDRVLDRSAEPAPHRGRRAAALRRRRDDVVVLEATIDDASPQLYEHVLERLLAAGARDAFLVPVVMKKSRPGVMLRVLRGAGRSRPPGGDRLRGDVDDRAPLDDRAPPRPAARGATVDTPWGTRAGEDRARAGRHA